VPSTSNPVVALVKLVINPFDVISDGKKKKSASVIPPPLINE